MALAMATMSSSAICPDNVTAATSARRHVTAATSARRPVGPKSPFITQISNVVGLRSQWSELQVSFKKLALSARLPSQSYRGHAKIYAQDADGIADSTPDGIADSTDAAEAVSLAVVTSAPTVEVVDKPLRPPKRKPRSLMHILEALHERRISAAKQEKNIPDIRPGDIVQLRVEVPQTKRRVSLLRGIVISRRNNGVNTTFRIRRVIAGVGVEIVFPLYSPIIKEITVLKHRKVRRAKLFYLRNKVARLSSF